MENTTGETQIIDLVEVLKKSLLAGRARRATPPPPTTTEEGR